MDPIPTRTESGNDCFPESTRFPDFSVYQCCHCKTYTNRLPMTDHDRFNEYENQLLKCSLCGHSLCRARCTSKHYEAMMICWGCDYETAASSGPHLWTTCGECEMPIDSSFIIDWIEYPHRGEGDTVDCNMDVLEDHWRRRNRYAKEQWLGQKAYIDVGKPPRDYKDELEMQHAEEAIGVRVKPWVWEEFKRLRAKKEAQAEDWPVDTDVQSVNPEMKPDSE